jgi:hypothetical protein
MEAHRINGTWELTDPVPGKTVIDNKWVCVVKEDKPEGQRYKCRLVAKGFTQKAGIDYHETFAPVVRIDSLRAICAIAAVQDLELDQVDVDTAFLHGELKEDIYMRQPPGYVSAEFPNKVCRLKKSLYGLKQAQHVYNKKWNDELEWRGYKQGNSDPCVRTLTRAHMAGVVADRDGSPAAVIGTYVDDSLIAGSRAAVDKVKADIKKVFPIKELGAAKKIIGIEVRRDRANRIIHLSQRKKIEELLERAKMADCHPVSTPMDPGTRLTDMMCAKTDEEKRDMEKIPYASIVGSLLYLSTGTRPDIAYAVGEVSRFMKDPGRGHWAAVKHLLRYLKGTVDWGIKFGGPGADLTVQGYSDADYAGAQDRRSTTGYVFMLAGGPVSWRSRRQKSVALSTMEAEYMSRARGDLDGAAHGRSHRAGSGAKGHRHSRGQPRLP